MSYGNKSFWKRTLAFVLTVLLVITSTPFSMQKVKAADTEFSIKLREMNSIHTRRLRTAPMPDSISLLLQMVVVC